MFGDILIVLSGCANDSATIDMGIQIARLEGARLSGLYLSRPGAEGKDYRIPAYQSQFDKKCLSNGIDGSFSVAFTKNPIHQILRMTRFADLVILSIKTRRRNPINISRFIKHCPTPIITINNPISPTLKRCLVINNNQSLLRFFLEMTRYLAEFWKIELLVLNHQEVKNQTSAHGKALEDLKTKNIIFEYYHAIELKTSDIVSIAIKNRSQLIMLLKFESKFFRKMIQGCRNEEIIYHSSIPIFFYR